MVTISSAASLSTGTATSGAGTEGSATAADLLKKVQKTVSSTSSGKTSSSVQDTVSLSAAAQALLANKSGKKNYGFTLTAKQQNAIATILQKYKGQSLTEANYQKIQADLKKVKLDTTTLSIKERARSFNPLGIFLAAMRGDDTSQSVAQNDSAAKIKANQFAKQVISDWSALSSSSSAASSSATSSA